ncbi:hypothetical protein TNCV_1170221 [Trichonephila clavipes]|nr:hypothetical protein TNCV_1170221 [Trichonephila clavipes]
MADSFCPEQKKTFLDSSKFQRETAKTIIRLYRCRLAMSVNYRVNLEMDRTFLFYLNPIHGGLSVHATEVQGIIDLLEPMNIDSNAKTGNGTPIKPRINKQNVLSR